MLFATLGKLDFITVLILMGAALFPHKWLLYASIYLLIKGMVFIYISRDFASYGDFISGIYLLILSYGLKIPFMHQAVLYWLIQKTFFTFVAIAIKLFLFYQEYKEEFPAILR